MQPLERNNPTVLKRDNRKEVLEVHFNPYDVGRCLGIKDVKSSIRNFNEKQLAKIRNSDVHDMHFRTFNNAGENFLTESGVYRLASKSRKGLGITDPLC